MPRALRPLLLSATVLLALPVGLALAGDDTARIGTATNVTFSGYTKDDEGRRLWTLTSDKASPLSGPGAGKNDWTLERVRIRLFDKTARAAVTIAAPNAQYRGDSRTAGDPGPINVISEGDGLKLAGRDWTWKNGEDKVDTITINADVRVSVTTPATPGKKAAPTLITARHLVATRDESGMKLAFDGDVRLVSENPGKAHDTVTLTCDKLSTRVKGSGDKPGAGSKSDAGFGLTSKLDRSDVERIDAEGHVRMTNAGMTISGNTGEIIPSKDLYSVTGDAEFIAAGNRRIRVNGDAMHFDKPAGRILVDPKADAADGRVTAELPCIDEARAKDPAKADERARVSGKKLEIRITPQSNTLLLTGDIRLDDPDYTGSCERLAVEAPRKSGPGADFIAVDNKGEPVKSVIAEDSVVLTRDKRTIRCGRAEIRPKENLTILTLSPRADDPTQGASLEATRMTLDSSDKLAQKLTAESAPDKPVKVTLPAMKQSGPTARTSSIATGPTTVESGLLVMTRRGDTGVFEFEDKVKIAGSGLDGSCDRLGVEVETRAAGKARTPDQHIRRIVAIGDVKLRQDAYSAEAARAEIYPNARLKELSVADDNGMDGKDPFFVSLSRDEAVSPGLRPKVTLPSMNMPGIEGNTTEEIRTPDTPAIPTTIEADYQELVHGSERLRAFARGDVRLIARGLTGRSASAELLATAKAEKPGDKPVFSPDTLVARGGVEVKFGDRAAKADTLEIFPQKNNVALTGHPTIDGWVTAPGVERKILDWVREPGPDGKPGTKLHIRDEPGPGLPTQIIRPRVVLPSESAPDLGRSLKNLDKTR